MRAWSVVCALTLGCGGGTTGFVRVESSWSTVIGEGAGSAQRLERDGALCRRRGEDLGDGTEVVTTSSGRVLDAERAFVRLEGDGFTLRPAGDDDGCQSDERGFESRCVRLVRADGTVWVPADDATRAALGAWLGETTGGVALQDAGCEL